MTEQHKQVYEENACPDCGSLWVWLKGWQPARGGMKRRLLCVKCGRTYIPKVEQDDWSKPGEKR